MQTQRNKNYMSETIRWVDLATHAYIYQDRISNTGQITGLLSYNSLTAIKIYWFSWAPKNYFCTTASTAHLLLKPLVPGSQIPAAFSNQNYLHTANPRNEHSQYMYQEFGTEKTDLELPAYC